MDKQTVDLYMMTNAKYFKPEDTPYIKQAIEKIDEADASNLHVVGLKDPTTTLIISIVGGTLGIDRFFLGDVGIGVAKLLTCGGLYIGAIVDWFLIQDRARDLNRAKLMSVVAPLQSKAASVSESAIDAITGGSSDAPSANDSGDSGDGSSNDQSWSDDVNKTLD